MKYNNELKKIKSLVSSGTWDILANSNAIIAGGAITSLFTNKEVNDIDVYFTSKKDFNTFINDVFEGSNELRLTNNTKKSILFLDTETQAKVQIIVYKTFKDVNHIFNEFDFTVCMGALNCSTEEFTFDDEFFKHNAQRYIQFNTNTAYPIISALRVDKYNKKGYNISKSQFLKIMCTINKLQIEKWDDFIEQVGGMYGLELSDVFPVTEEFSIDKAIECLGDISSNDDGVYKDLIFNPDNQYNVGKIYELYPHLMGKSKNSASGRYFKNVKMIDGKFCSVYKHDFIYPINGEVDGGRYGIYCYKFNDVLNGIYNAYNCIIEVIPTEETTEISRDGDKIQIFGKLSVGNRFWTRDEFYKEFIEMGFDDE